MKYDFELDKVVEKIKSINAKTILIQLPDGLKMNFKEIVDYLEKKTDSLIYIWGGSCFGACDIPCINIDLIDQFGHNQFNF